MKALIIIILFSLVACNRESSPEGRSQIRDENLQAQIDSLKHQNTIIIDRINVIHEELKTSKHK